MNTLPVRDTIKSLGSSAVANAMGMKVSTISTWMIKDRIPGRGPTHEFLAQRFTKAVKELKRRGKPRKAA